MDTVEETLEFKNIDITDDKYVEEDIAFAHRRTLLIVTIGIAHLIIPYFHTVTTQAQSATVTVSVLCLIEWCSILLAAVVFSIVVIHLAFGAASTGNQWLNRHLGASQNTATVSYVFTVLLAMYMVHSSVCTGLANWKYIVPLADPQIQIVDFQKLMEMGMNVIRLKTSHCTETDRIKMLSRIDKATRFLARKHGLLEWPCATCIELKTSIIQTGLLEEDAHHILIETNTEVTLTTDISEFDKCNQYRIFVDDPYLTSDVKIGMEINIAQDEIILVCTAKDEKSLKCTVIQGGNLGNLSCVYMRGGSRSHPYLTHKDYHLLQFAVEYQVDMIIINYARNIEAIVKVKKFLGCNLVKRPMLIAGISSQEGLMNLDDFVRDADGILLSREFLPYEVKPELYNRMGRIQSYVAGKCRQAGKPFYISGEVLQETLLTGHLCIREISDVTNALLEGTSGFVLSECLDINHMCDAMKIMNDLCTSVEPLCVNKTDFWHIVSQMKMPLNAAEASAMSCAVIANHTNARVIILPTVSGRTANLLNWLRPNSIIIGVSTKTRTVRQMKMYRSLVPLLYKGPPRRTWFNTVQARVTFALQYAVEHKWIDCGDSYISLEKATEESSFCDAVRMWNVSEKATRRKMECPESYHDFDINSFAEPTTSRKRRERASTSKVISKVIEKVSVTEEQETTEEQVTETERKESIDKEIVKDHKEYKKEEGEDAEEGNENQTAIDNPEDNH